eukprot:TRINITY_DN724_c0_g1_i1.p1 TRINITY_DN724_c0_g1~~TRINITY_DN724_c0_g1_i1.p1  ORF type:complete len:1451 (+),score=398.06 TRINITY_DN724_c0_g1_i1:96-4448(+)
MSHGWTEHFTAEGQPYYFNTITNATQWEKPKELLQGDELEEGDWCWCPDEEEGFLPAKLMGRYNNKVELQLRDGRRVYVNEKEYEHIPLSMISLSKSVDDLVLLDDMNTPLIMHQIKERAAKKQIYTRVGTILISVNPYEMLPLYTASKMDDYAHRGDRELPPHPFEIGDTCYKDLFEDKVNQSILVSGESGAGKTEATKVILQFLAEVAGSESGVEQRILKSNPILEAFGNAKTIRNNNSSRFGKWIEIHFTPMGQICGSKINNYLLEKSRVVHQAPSERNYHIFYQILKGDKQMCQEFGLGPVESYHYLNQSGCIDVENMNDEAEFQEVLESMEDLGFQHDEKIEIFRLVCAVLVLGNVNFVVDPRDDTKSVITNPEVVAQVADLLSINADQLATALTIRTMTLRGETMIIPLNPSSAEECRDSLAKHLYGELFEWLVRRVNVALRGTLDQMNETRVIGVLDIFGFEIFEKNSFEQLCINFTNEKLQQKFNQTTFKEEEAVYEREKISFDSVEFIDNQSVLDLIEKKPAGIMVLLDEELKMPRRSDENFLQKCSNAHGSNERFSMPVKIRNAFTIEHYAGGVTYDVIGFLDKNKDQMYDDLIDVMNATSNSFISEIMGDQLSTGGSKASLGYQFRTQLNSLMELINSTSPHYIRCVKPNSVKRPAAEVFDTPMSTRQLRYAGVFEAVEIRRRGYPFRYTHEKFYKRYRCLAPHITGTNWLQNCKDILKYVPGDWSDIQYGSTMILYRASAQRQLDLQRSIAVRTLTIRAQALYKKYAARKEFLQMNDARKVLSAAISQRSVDALRNALNSISDINFEMYETKEAKRLLHYLQEEIRLRSIFDDLINRLANVLDPPSHDLSALEKAVSDADAVGLDNSQAARARELLSTIHDRIATKHELEEGVKTHNLEMLEAAVARCAGLSISMSSAPVVAAQNEIQRIKQENTHKDALIEALSVPPYGLFGGMTIDDRGEVALSSTAQTELPKRLTAAKNFGVLTPHGITTVATAEVVCNIRNSIERDDWEAVERIVIESKNQELIEAPEIKAAQDQVSLRKSIAETSENLQYSASIYDAASLAVHVQTAYTLLMEGIEPYQQLLDSILAIQAACKQALATVDLAQLRYACDLAEQIAYPHQDYLDTRVLRDIVEGLTQELTEYLQVVPEREDLDHLLQRCYQVNLNTAQTEELSQLVNQGEEDLVKSQMKAALAQGNNDRVFQKTVQLKDLFLSQFGDSIRWTNFPLLKTPSEYAKAQLFGKDKLKENMRIWTKSPIPTSLLNIEDKIAAKEAVKIHKDLLGWCGEKNNAYPAMLAREIIERCLEHEELRNECYVQMLKHLTQNPSEQSKQKCFKLMYICLKCFTPGEFENFLEMFLRRAGDQYWYIIQAMHETGFHGNAAAPPSAEEILAETSKEFGPRPPDFVPAYTLQSARTLMTFNPNPSAYPDNQYQEQY